MNMAKAKLEEVFRSVFELPADEVVEHIRQINFPKWDSLGHVLLIAAIENEFGLNIEPSDSFLMTSFEALELFLSERR